MTDAFPRRLVLLAAMNAARERGDLEAFYQLQDEHLQELTGRARRSDALGDLEARLARLDARVKQAPGQLGFDLGGDGQPCGRGFISPDFTCHKNGGTAVLSPPPPPPPPAPKDPPVIQTAEPFKPEEMQRIKAGIQRRTFAVDQARHTGADLAAALEKLASEPTPQGVAAREAMAFMDEVQAIVKIGPTTEALPNLEITKLVKELDFNRPVDEIVDEMNAYLEDAENTAQRGRSFGRRFGYLTPERLTALKADKSPVGYNHSRSLEKALDPSISRSATFEQRRKEFAEAAAALKQAPEDSGARQRFSDLFNYLRMSSWMDFGPHGQLAEVQTALREASGLPGTGGHYMPGGNAYHVVSRAGALRGMGALRPDEVHPGSMAMHVADTLRDRGRKPYLLKQSVGLSSSEQALITHLHELGHLVHDASARAIVNGDNNGDPTAIHFRVHSTKRASSEAREVHKAKAGPTGYSDTNVGELFAESFAAYVAAPNVLQTEMPALHKWITVSLARARKAARMSRTAGDWYLI